MANGRNFRKVFMKKMVVISILIGGCIGLALIKRSRQAKSISRYTLALVQTASHPALDAVRDGFMEEVRGCLGNDVSFVVQNAQGSVSQLHAVAQQFHAQAGLDGIFAIATPAAQAISAVEKQKPVIIAAVTDPEALGLVYEGTNVCGIRDMINVSAEVEMLKMLLPTVQSVGLLYTSGEANSVVLVKKMREELEKRGLKAIDFALSSEADVQAMTEVACRKVDALLAPTDNTIASTIAVSSTLAQKYKKPFIVSDNMLVAAGPLAARGIDYRESGKQAGRMACKLLLEGKKPSELSIEEADSRDVYFNKKTADLLGIAVPETMQNLIIVE